MALRREELLRSLERQKRLLSASIVLTPVDSLPLALADRHRTAFLHGLYLSDKRRDRGARLASLVQFGRRERAARDLAAIHAFVARAFGAAEGSLRVLSGLHAHAVTFMSVADIGDTVMVLSEDGGGHFNTHAILHRLGLRTVDIPLDRHRMCVDRTATVDLVAAERPSFLFVDRSEGLRYEDFSFIADIEGPTKVFDASHYVPQILTGRYENPLLWGFDLMLFSLHKSFPGPQKAAVLARDGGPLWDRLVRGLSTFVSSSHAENTYLSALAFLDEDALHAYVTRMLDTASALETGLRDRSVPVVERSAQGDEHWPPTQHVWLRALGQDDAFDQFERLGRIRVHANYRKLPYGLGYGLRLGTTFSAIAGLAASDVPELADIVATALHRGPSAPLRHRVRDLAAEARRRAIVAPEHWL